MQNPFVSKVAARTVPAMFLCGLLYTITPAHAADAVKTCSNQILHGTYAFTIEGTLAVPGSSLVNGAGLPLRGVALTNYDGQGNLTQIDHVVVNGTPPAADWTPGIGTYTVNPDCTGVAVINSASSPGGPLNLHFVVGKLGNEIREVVDINAVTSIGVRVD